MSEQSEGRCLVHKDCDVAHTVPQGGRMKREYEPLTVEQQQYLEAENARLQELLEAAETQLEKDRKELWRSGRKAERTTLRISLNLEIAKLVQCDRSRGSSTCLPRIDGLIFVRDHILSTEEED